MGKETVTYVLFSQYLSNSERTISTGLNWKSIRGKRSPETHKPPDPNIAVATPDTYLTTLGSIRRNLKSPKST